MEPGHCLGLLVRSTARAMSDLAEFREVDEIILTTVDSILEQTCIG